MKKWLLLIAFCCAGLIPAGAEEPEDVPPPPPPPKSEKERRTSFAIWRAFSSLPEKERQEMVKLQRTDPEKFRKVMTEKGEALLKADRARLIELRSMVAEYISTADSDRREELYKKIEANVRFDYFKRLEENRRHLEEMKRRARGLEAELNKREKNAEAAIKARIDAILRGDPDPEAPRPHPRRKK